jgi:hypothetical protein
VRATRPIATSVTKVKSTGVIVLILSQAFLLPERAKYTRSSELQYEDWRRTTLHTVNGERDAREGRQR